MKFSRIILIFIALIAMLLSLYGFFFGGYIVFIPAFFVLLYLLTGTKDKKIEIKNSSSDDFYIKKNMVPHL